MNGKGIARDEKMAVIWYQKAAVLGHADAQNNLGCCYYNGIGVAKNLVLAKLWYEKAVTQGNTSAKQNLPICLQELAERKKAKIAKAAAQEVKLMARCSQMDVIQEEAQDQVEETECLQVEFDRLRVSSQKPNDSEPKAMANSFITLSSTSSGSSHSNSSSSDTVEPKAFARQHISSPS